MPHCRLQTPPINALLGKARYNSVRYKYSHALEVLNSALQLYPNFLPALTEKITVQMAKQEWEAAVETARRYSATAITVFKIEQPLFILLLSAGVCQ